MRHHFVAGKRGYAIEESAFSVAQRMFKNHRELN
jgi:hypothetical protein